MEKFFGLKKHGTTVRTEILAGLTTFMAMAYILMVNANMFANPFSDGTNVLGVSYGAIYIATAISAVIGSVLIDCCRICRSHRPPHGPERLLRLYRLRRLRLHLRQRPCVRSR